jgi:hypothetical protein
LESRNGSENEFIKKAVIAGHPVTLLPLVFQLEDYVSDEQGDNNEVVCARQWMLPSTHFHGLWYFFLIKKFSCLFKPLYITEASNMSIIYHLYN